MNNFCTHCGTKLPDNALFCPQCGTRVVAAPQANEVPGNEASAQNKAPEKTTYDVFLSYSHRDSEAYGIEYIQRIKEEIEKALDGIVDQPKVFLDVDALKLGLKWHSTIMESLRQCKVFICLVSEEYLKSAYSTRERLWWNAKQTHDGRLLGEGPYPVYYAKLEDGLFSERPDVKELMATQTDSMPWFELKTQLQEDFIRERLASITSIVRKKTEAANQAFQSFCSVRPPLCDNFVGRVTELRELHELCAEGKYPVIQAAGGVGKTELSVAYAYGFADQYPMGRFLLRMEGIHSWDDAFSAMLDMEGTGADGGLKKVSAELGIDEEKLKKDSAERHHAAADALLKRAQRGKLLILLDNLDDENLLKPARMRNFLCDSQFPSTIHVLTTTRSTFHFSERGVFTSFELGNLEEDEAFEMLCLTGNGQYPFDMQPPTAENKEYQAAHEVIKLLDGHAWSMEIISAFMADNYDSKGFTFEMELSKMKKGLNIEAEDGTYRSGTATPEALLQPTLEKLSSQELGAETLELLTFASCFNADNIPVIILEAYWQKYYPDVECTKGKPFVFVLKQLTKYHLLSRNGKTCKMHRLLQSVMLKNVEPLVGKFGVFLKESYLVEQRYWVDLLLNVQELFDYCSKEVLAPRSWIKLFANSFFIDKCPWKMLDGNDWSWLLRDQPQFAERCPWEKLDGWDWSWLLRDQPQFADRCPWEKLHGGNWAVLLREQPQFADRCPWEKLDKGWDWAELLVKQPQFADRCPWEMLSGSDWKDLLHYQPQFADGCPWEKLDGWDWANLLGEQPQFADKCPWEKLPWVKLLVKQPQFADRCPWEKSDGWDWADLLGKQPQFADRCPWEKLAGRDWVRLLRKQPQFADKCPWEKLNDRHLAYLLGDHPQFADKCPWEKLDGGAWARLLSDQPQFADKCPWKKLSGRDWASLLWYQPQFADKCPWEKLDGWNWATLLRMQPQFANKCPWKKLSGRDWELLLGERHCLSLPGQSQPQFADRCLWEKLDGGNWVSLLKQIPQFAERCQWEKLDGKNWSDLLQKQPQFADRCPWDKLDIEDWAKLLEPQPQLATYFPGEMDGEEWVSLLLRYPQFAVCCPWDILEGKAWCWLLSERPQFADKCHWDKLDGVSWSALLSIQPKFADKCQWDKLNGENWSDLLQEQPQFAYKCAWKKLEDKDWKALLEKQPQFANRRP